MDKKELKTVMEKEIDLVQGCISRMAQNSFVIKGWTITLIALPLHCFLKSSMRNCCVALVLWRQHVFGI